MDRIWTECSVADANGLCGKPVKDPMPGALGFCEEHSAHGYCCKCGAFLLGPSTGVRRVESGGLVHTAFSCASPSEGKEPTT